MNRAGLSIPKDLYVVYKTKHPTAELKMKVVLSHVDKLCVRHGFNDILYDSQHRWLGTVD